MIQSVMNIQTAFAKALLVDAERLAEAQAAGDVLAAHRVFMDAFETDVRPTSGPTTQRARSRGRSGRGLPCRRPCRGACGRTRKRQGRKRVRALVTLEGDLELENLALVHRAVAVGHLVERSGPVEDAARLDPTLQDVR